MPATGSSYFLFVCFTLWAQPLDDTLWFMGWCVQMATYDLLTNIYKNWIYCQKKKQQPRRQKGKQTSAVYASRQWQRWWWGIQFLCNQSNVHTDLLVGSQRYDDDDDDGNGNDDDVDEKSDVWLLLLFHMWWDAHLTTKCHRIGNSGVAASLFFDVAGSFYCYWLIMSRCFFSASSFFSKVPPTIQVYFGSSKMMYALLFFWFYFLKKKPQEKNMFNGTYLFK